MNAKELATEKTMIQMWKSQIDGMSQTQLARLWRFSLSGHPVFQIPELTEYFNMKFKGFTPEISKTIGWDG